MGQKNKEEEIIPAGQEDIKPLTTANSVVDGGTLVRPKEDTVIYGAPGSLLGEGVKHIVHRALAEKLINKGLASDEAPSKDKASD